MTLVEMQPIQRGLEANKLAQRISEALKELGPLTGGEMVRVLAERMSATEDDIVFALGRVALNFRSDGLVSGE